MSTDRVNNTAMLSGILSCSMLAAYDTSIYTALFGALLLLLMLLVQRLANSLTMAVLPPRATSALAAFATGAAVTQLLALASEDLRSAFAPIIVFATVASVAPIDMHAAPRKFAKYLLLAILAGAVVELLAWGTLPGDREIAFGGALRALELRITETGWLPWLAAPAGGLLTFSLLAMLVAPARREKQQQPKITAPRAGRRVRVTGQIR